MRLLLMLGLLVASSSINTRYDDAIPPSGGSALVEDGATYGSKPRKKGMGGAETLSAAPAHICMIVNHDTIFTASPSEMCKASAPWNDITIAAQCSNRALACANQMTLLVVGSPTRGAAASWTVSPIPRLHNNQTVVAALEAFVGSQPDSPCESGASRNTELDEIKSRHPTWNKVLLLMHGAALLPECDVLGTMDPDVQLVPSAEPLAHQEQIVKWLASGKAFFISREPPISDWVRGGVKDYHGRNNLNNTAVNAGFVMTRTQAPARKSLLHQWWCSADAHSKAVGDLGEPLSVYRQAWPMEGRGFHHTLLPQTRHVAVADAVTDYNTPQGRFARHFWYKPDAAAAAEAGRFVRLLQRRVGSSGTEVALQCAAQSSKCSLPPRSQYVSSLWEKRWLHDIDELQSPSYTWKAGCEVMREEGSQRNAKKWLEAIAGERAEWSPDVFSYHKVFDTCTGRLIRQMPIEPLVGILRHPFAICAEVEGHNYGVDKTYMLPMARPSKAGKGRNFLFDLGASLYSQGIGGSSQDWFINAYGKLGIKFDRILAWEATPANDDEIFKAMPYDVYDHLSYYNVPVTALRSARDNPLRVLAAVTTPDDFVVIKIDIDYPAIEHALLEEILADASVHSRIDELFYEDHVQLHPFMHGPGPWLRFNNGPLPNRTLSESYDLFLKLRQLGIRAHSWV